METPPRRLSRQTSPRFEVLDHTADATIAAQGETLAELLENLAYGMVSLAWDPDSVRAEHVTPIAVQASTPPDLVVAWLKEILFRSETEGLAFANFQAETTRTLEGWEAHGRAWGEPWHEGIRRRGAVVKAVTYHRLQVEETPRGWRAEVTFDV